jgi:hypothetical protein
MERRDVLNVRDLDKKIALFEAYLVFVCLSFWWKQHTEIRVGPLMEEHRRTKLFFEERHAPCRFGNENYHVDSLEYEPGPRGEMSVTNRLRMVCRSL